MLIEKRGKRFFSFDKAAFALLQRHFGEGKEGYVVYTPYEVLYLVENKKAIVKERGKELSFKALLSALNEEELLEWTVFRDLIKRGYAVKPGIKFGGNFIIYAKGKKPGIDHSDWIGIVLKKTQKLKAENIISKARIAHSTAKRLLLCVVDGSTVLYYELQWKKI
ncbi:MAG: tRNA-intron lyase [Candidatus Pacearchaeota archaeon]